ncbi:MAG TPA: ABC transporter, partial [Clostridiales bacterium]|nr:ABC transporter [Clostridiales bacterium]
MFSTISGEISALIGMAPNFGRGADAFASISEIMNATDVEQSLGNHQPVEIAGDVEFKDVCYRYPNGKADVVSDFSLKAERGECVAFVGASGSGKSTIMNLITGLLTPTSGKILIDGKPLEEYDLQSYRHNISVVPQNSILFTGTIRENITYGLERYGEEDLQRVVEMANINEFLKDLPNGLDTDVGEHGDKLSGGQKQRITIARALIRNPKILILDEAT